MYHYQLSMSVKVVLNVQDIYSRLLRDRIILYGTPSMTYVANAVIAQCFFYRMEDAKKDISLYINSPGECDDGMAIYDTMQFGKCDIVTYCVSQAASMSTCYLQLVLLEAICFPE